MRLVEEEHPARWGGYHPVAIDDTKEHRTSEKVWGTCTFHECRARSANRARRFARTIGWCWAICRPASRGPTCPWPRGCTFARANCPKAKPFARKRRWPWKCCGRRRGNRKSPFWPRLTGLRDGDGHWSVPESAGRNAAIEFVTRLRKTRGCTSRCSRPRKIRKAAGRANGANPACAAKPRKVGGALATRPPIRLRPGAERPLQTPGMLLVGKRTGGDHVISACFEVPGYDKLWATITSAADLSAGQTLAANAGRFRQEDGFRDHKQRLGMEECRAGPKSRCCARSKFKWWPRPCCG